MIGKIILAVLILLSFGVFIRRLNQLFRFVKLGQGELTLDSAGAGIKRVLITAFGQKTVVREVSGWGHFLIFWGFMFLTFGTVEGLLAGFIDGFSFSFLGLLYPVMNTGQDLFGVLVLAAIVVALVRRIIIKPVRLEGPKSHTLDAFFVLGLISALIICFYGMRTQAVYPGFTPVSSWLRGLCGSRQYDSIFHIFDWCHNLVVLFFLSYIPYSKHIHLVGAIPNIFFTNPDTPRGVMEKLDLEDESSENFGVAKINDYTKKDLIDLYACTECGRCQESCPAYATEKPLSPKHVIQDLKVHLFHAGPGLLIDPKSEPEQKLIGDIITPDVMWSCTTCRACEEVCPEFITPMSKLFGLRQNRVLMEGDFPEEAQMSLKNVETQSNPWGMAQEERGKWANGLDIKTMADDSEVEYLYYVGCSGSYDYRNIKVTKAVAELLNIAGVNFAILGAEEGCCGDSARRIGNEYLYQMLAQQNVESFNRYKVKKIITSCPHGFNTIKNEYPQFGGEYEVIHHTELLAVLVREGKLKPIGSEGKVVFHDSCYLGRYNDIFDAPRDVIKASGSTCVEMDRNHEKSFCCGAGGGRMWMEETLGTGININRTKEALASGAGTIAAACPMCLTMLTDGVKDQGKIEDVKVLDVAEILLKSMRK